MRKVFYDGLKAARYHKLGITLSPGENEIRDENIAAQLLELGIVKEVTGKKSVKSYEDKSLKGSSELNEKTQRKGFLN